MMHFILSKFSHPVALVHRRRLFEPLIIPVPCPGLHSCAPRAWLAFLGQSQLPPGLMVRNMSPLEPTPMVPILKILPLSCS